MLKCLWNFFQMSLKKFLYMLWHHCRYSKHPFNLPLSSALFKFTNWRLNRNIFQKKHSPPPKPGLGGAMQPDWTFKRFWRDVKSIFLSQTFIFMRFYVRRPYLLPLSGYGLTSIEADKFLVTFLMTLARSVRVYIVLSRNPEPWNNCIWSWEASSPYSKIWVSFPY